MRKLSIPAGFCLALTLGILGVLSWSAGLPPAPAAQAAAFAPAGTGLTPTPADPGARHPSWWRLLGAKPGAPVSAPAVLAPASPVPCGVQGPWQYGPNNPPARWAVQGVVGTDGKFYVAGGISTSFTPYADAARFNATTNAWEPLPPLPVAVGQMAPAWDGGNFYVAGGYRGSGGQVTNAFQVYSTSTNAWAAGPPLPTALEAAAGASLGGKIYVMGGDNGTTQAFTTNYIFDTATQTWATGAPLPAARTTSYAAVAGGLIYLFGGEDGTFHAVDTLWVYSPATNTWASLAAANTGGLGNYPGLSPLDPGRLLATAGGNTNNVTSVKTFIYSIATNTWSPGLPLNQARDAHAQGTLPDGRVIVFGGLASANPFQLTDSTELLAPPLPCDTPTPVATPTLAVTPTPAPPTTTPTPCAPGQFSDVQPADYFYTPVQYLVSHGVVSGYGDCTFRPYNNTTRSQMVKIVVLGFQTPAYTPPAGGYTFADVPPTFPFFAVIETAAHATIVSGYGCGGLDEPCDALNRPYFRPYAYVTRGQLAKITAAGAGWALNTPLSGTFADVLPNTAFYPFVETAVCHGVISGYGCGGPGEPCDAGNRPYFRPANQATRGQIAKIEYGAITGTGTCPTPTAVP